MDSGRHLYLILHPNHSLIASALPPDLFVKHYVQGSSRYFEGRLIFAELAGGWRHPFFDIDGAFAGQMVAKAKDVVKVPDGISMPVAAYCACGAGTAYNALRKLGLTSADTIIIFGLGPVGLAAVAFAHDFGARVAAVDVSAERRELAGRAGADLLIDPRETEAAAAVLEWNGRGASVGLDASGNPHARHQLLDAMTILGRVAFVGEGGDVRIDVSEQIIHKQLTVVGSWVFFRLRPTFADYL